MRPSGRRRLRDLGTADPAVRRSAQATTHRHTARALRARDTARRHRTVHFVDEHFARVHVRLGVKLEPFGQRHRHRPFERNADHRNAVEICQRALTATNSGALNGVTATAGFPNAAIRLFCFLEWAQHESRTPGCRQRPKEHRNPMASIDRFEILSIAGMHHASASREHARVTAATTRRTASRPGSGPTRAAGSSRWSRKDEGRRRLGEHVQPLRPDLAVRRLQGIRVRARGRHARPARLRPARGPLRPEAGRRRRLPAAIRRADRRPQDLQAVHRRGVPADRVRPLVPGQRRGRHAARQRLPASRKDLRDAVRAARKAADGWAGRDRDEPRPGPVPRGRADGGPARPVRRRGLGRGGAARRQRAARSSTAPSTAGSGTPAGPTRSPRSSARRTRSRPRTSTSRSPSRPASSASSRRRRRRCSGWSAGSRRRWCRGNTVVLSPPRRGRCRR